MFVLNQKLASDTCRLGDFDLSQLLLMNNKCYPWLILVPRVDDLVEITDLSSDDRAVLMEEIATTSDVMKRVYWPDKMNVAALGNQVEQLHVHVIARFKTDDAWPEPIWGKEVQPYKEGSLVEARDILVNNFNKLSNFRSFDKE